MITAALPATGLRSASTERAGNKATFNIGGAVVVNGLIVGPAAGTAKPAD